MTSGHVFASMSDHGLASGLAIRTYQTALLYLAFHASINIVVVGNMWSDGQALAPPTTVGRTLSCVKGRSGVLSLAIMKTRK